MGSRGRPLRQDIHQGTLAATAAQADYRALPSVLVPRIEVPGPSDGRLPTDLEAPWQGAPRLGLLRAETGNQPQQSTELRLLHDSHALWLRFDCQDQDPWATYRQRDEPLWEEEVVEVFLAPEAPQSSGQGDWPHKYVEIEVNPLGTLFDALISNPHVDRQPMEVDTAWDLEGLRARVLPLANTPGWQASFCIPWLPLTRAFQLPPEPLPRAWRANFYRIDRPRSADAQAEYSAWSPTYVQPADFHRPRRFGRLLLSDTD